MAFALVVDTAAQSPNSATVTTPAVDTTGADLIVIVIFSGQVTTTVNDFYANSWAELTTQSGSGYFLRLFYCLNPNVGPGHHFTGGGNVGEYPAIAVQAFSGAHASSSFEAESGVGSGSGQTIQPGILTPSQNSELLVTASLPSEGAGGGGGAYTQSVDSSFIETADMDEGGNAVGGGMAYKIQVTTGAENPTWTGESAGTPPNMRAAIMACFRAAVVATGRRFLLTRF